MRVLIATDDERSGRRIRQILSENDVECPAGHVIPLELAAERASRVLPELLLTTLSCDPAATLQALRDICNIVPNVHALVIGPATDPKLILETLHERAAEYLDETALEEELAGALRYKAKGNLLSERQEAGRIISILAASGGSGSSTLAASVSSVLASKYGECGLMDLRLSAGDLTSMLDLKPTRTIADFCDCLTRVDRSMFEQFFVRHECGIFLLPAPVLTADLARVTSKGVQRALALSRVRFPYVLVDLDNCVEDRQIEALWQSDVILLVVRLDYTSVRNTRRAIDSLVELGIGAERIRLVANGCGQRKELRAAQAEEALGRKILHYIPSDPASVHQAINKGVPVALYRPSAKISRRIYELAASVNGRDSNGQHP